MARTRPIMIGPWVPWQWQYRLAWAVSNIVETAAIFIGLALALLLLLAVFGETLRLLVWGHL